MPVEIPKNENRTIEQLREHYEIERDLANTLRNASKEERRYLFPSLYDELYRRVTHHPRLTHNPDSKAYLQTISTQIRLLNPFLKSQSIFLEVGPGDCSLSLAVAKLVKKVYAVDVSEESTKGLPQQDNFELILSDGCTIPIPENSVNIAYSNQLMEHLHPDDAFEQLDNIYKALAPGGIYICTTPHRFSGPHDISMYFSDVATGFHLKEYTNIELRTLFKTAGFSKIKTLVGFGGRSIVVPISPAILIETLLERSAHTVRRRISSWLPLRLILGIRLVAIK